MDFKQIKEKYKRFRQWQQHPIEYNLDSGATHHCNNCGNDFTGNYCPFCSQRYSTGDVSWRSVRQGLMDIWGLGSRSLPYTILQLFLRPGFLISDYITGKRQMSFPPVKMLFIIAIIYSFLAYWLFPEVFHLHTTDDITTGGRTDELLLWYKNHFSWATLTLSMMAILPTWVMFRYSPRNTRHTLPKGFFIQVFFQIISTVLSIVFLPFELMNSVALTFIALGVNAFYYLIGYMQLFGYSIWGTLWRQGFVIMSGAFSLCAVVMIGFPDAFGLNQGNELKKLIPVFVLVLAAIILGVGHLVNLLAIRFTRYRQAKKEAGNYQSQRNE